MIFSGLSEPQIKILMRIITANCTMDGEKVDIAEFLGRFKVIYSKAISQTAKDVPWINLALQSIGKAILSDKAETARRYFEEQEVADMTENPTERRRSSALRAVALFQKFRDFDSSGDGYLSYEDFASAIYRLPLEQISEEIGFPLTLQAITKIAEAIDVTRSKRINYFEFLQAFHVVDGNSRVSVAEELWNHICTVIYQHRSSLRTALHQIDSKCDGKVTIAHFRAAVETLNTVLGYSTTPLTDEQIDSLAHFIDIDVDGLFNYEEFLDCFHPVDTMKPTFEISSLKTTSPSDHLFIDEEDPSLISRRRRAFLNQVKIL
ncbi:hypothetical protein IE077_000502 [Cardiosporidium cionae]|uniref:EF-hand domain-containing protein n=1 Tax=Cardiosporidium cionae TaxID=476202 RepID=A0ABQ7J8Y9_9APIC|nr:hypothetical protein IE077_000502 [Cardiosporidium cionae]|eukprot:KAF8820394.1 hypothetical protein IE077_000502 [Cardiosporidium cionae]